MIANFIRRIVLTALIAIGALAAPALAQVRQSAMIGLAKGQQQTVQCPPGTGLTSLLVAGDADTVALIQMYCRDYAAAAKSSVPAASVLGNPGGVKGLPVGLSCENPLSEGIDTLTIGFATRNQVYGITGTCRTLTGSKGTSFGYAPKDPSKVIRTQTTNCADGQIAVGLSGWSVVEITAISLVCASSEIPGRPAIPVDNAALDGGAGSLAVSQVGSVNGTKFVAACPAGQAMVGWGYNTTNLLTAVAPICQGVVDKQLQGRLDIDPKVAAGADAPDARRGIPIFCPAEDGAVRELEVSLTASATVHDIRPMCHVTSGSRASHYLLPTVTRVLGDSGVSKGRSTCKDSYAIGFAGTVTRSSISSLGLLCVTSGATPPALQPQAQAANNGNAPASVPVRLTVEIYAAPGGAGKSTGDLAAGTAGVTLLAPCADNWCHVSWPGHEGWVYSGPDYQSLGLPK